jgi:CheY-like chemotaxis protein
MLRKRFLRHPVKVIALTADVTNELREELIREGIDSYMTKPVSLEGLGQEIRRLLDQDRLASRPIDDARLP